jgi:hypothetical protein
VTELGGQHDLIATAGQHLAEDLLRTPGAVAVGGIEQRDPGLHGRVHHGAGRVDVQPAADVVAAEAGHRDDEPRRAQ